MRVLLALTITVTAALSVGFVVLTVQENQYIWTVLAAALLVNTAIRSLQAWRGLAQ